MGFIIFVYDDMHINDDYIISKFFNKHGKLNGNHSTEHWLANHDQLALDYLYKRFPDANSLREIFLRIYFNINKRPTCPICGAPVKWCGKKSTRLFSETCCKKDCWVKYREHTYIERYGKIINNGGTSEAINKACRTKLERYGDQWYNNKEKRIETNLQRYGNIAGVNEEIINKRKQTSLLHYGVDSPAKSDIIKEKYRQTCLARYGVDNYRKTSECCDKIIHTKKKNGTINSSSYEKRVYNWLIEIFGRHDIICQYTDCRYTNPTNGHKYHCDFYVKSLDLFIELQIFWAHGSAPFTGTQEDNRYLSELKEKAKVKPIYNRMIEGWAGTDIVKRNVAANNRLKFIEIYDRSITKDKLLNIIKEYNND